MSDLPKDVARAARRFSKELPKFYATFADRLDHAGGVTAQELFALDASRYSQDEDGNAIETPRGVLSRYWAERFIETGGNFANTFAETIPSDDAAMIRLAQAAGAGALPLTLRDLARTSALIQNAKAKFVGTVAISVFAALLFFGVLLITPTVSVPMFKDLYGGVPKQYHSGAATALFAFGDAVNSVLLILVVLMVGGGYFVVWSLPNLTGDLRRVLDRWSIWRLYRDFYGALFLAVLSTMVKTRGGVSTTLGQALKEMRTGANPYKQWHMDLMIDRVEGSALGPGTKSDVEALNTGLIDRDSYFYLLDVYQGQGLAIALDKAGSQVETHALVVVETRAKWFARILLLVAFSLTAGWAVWHLLVAFDFPTAMSKYSQAN